MSFRRIILAVTVLISVGHAQPTSQPALYREDFQKLEASALPHGARALSGEFTVAVEAADHFLRLAPTPLNGHGILIGPERDSATAIRARVRSATTGRRFPEMGVGLGGVGGYKLFLMPAVGELQIRQNHVILARAPFAWTSGTWTNLLFEFRIVENRPMIAGKAWADGAAEPAAWMVRYEPTSPPPKGQPSLWGSAYSEQPVDFDDVAVEAR
jgi:hypothetical protein